MGFFSGLGSALFSGGASLLGGLMTNSANKDMSGDQMAFQERMRDTQYQAAVKDLSAAGLNPMLAYGNGGAAAPSGAAIAMQNPVPSAISSAVDAANVQKVRADTLVSAAQAARISADLPKAELKGEFWNKAKQVLKPLVHSADHGRMTNDAVDGLKELYPEEFSAPADTRSPVRQFIDKVGEWNPYGL